MPSASKSGTMAIEIVVAEHRVNVAAQRFTQTRDAFEAGLVIAAGAPAIISRQHTEIIFEAAREFGDPLQSGAAHICVQIAQMQDGESIESIRQTQEAHSVAPQLHLARVFPPPPIGPGDAQHHFDRRLHQGHVLYVHKAEPLAERLRLVLALDAETQPCVRAPKSAFKTAHGFVGIE